MKYNDYHYEYQECDVILSNFVLPQTDMDGSSTERGPADIRGPPCHTAAQFRPLIILLRCFRIQPIAPDCWWWSSDVSGSRQSLSGWFCDTWRNIRNSTEWLRRDYDDYHYDSHYDDCPGYYDYDDPDDYQDYHGSHRDYDDNDGCGDYGDYDGDVTADVSSLEEYPRHDVIRSDVILPQTDSDVLEISVVGAVGMGAHWSQTGGWGDWTGFHRWCRVSGDYSRDVDGGADVSGQPSFGVGRFVSVGGPARTVGVWRSWTLLTNNPVRSNAGQAVRRQKCLYDPWAVKRIFTFGDWTKCGDPGNTITYGSH